MLEIDKINKQLIMLYQQLKNVDLGIISTIVTVLYSGPSLIRIAWDQSPFRLVKFSD